MNVLYLLIPIALVIGAGALAAFFWALRSGQFDDHQTPAQRILFDDPSPRDLSTKTDTKPQGDTTP